MNRIKDETLIKLDFIMKSSVIRFICFMTLTDLSLSLRSNEPIWNRLQWDQMKIYINFLWELRLKLRLD